MKVVILAGGKGARLSEETDCKPKPMVVVGDQPILWHIMNIYSFFGHKEFALALGYKGQVIKDHFIGRPKDDWLIHFADTGENSGTGGRLRKLREWIGNEAFMLTYGDGLANININELIAFHRRQGKLATVTAVRPPARFGGLEFDGDLVTSFIEKPQIGEGWINGGFFILEPKVLDYIDGDDTMFEQKPLEQLTQNNQLVAYRHHHFWQCMDTLRDVRLLDALWKSGKAPWRIW